MKKKVIAYPHIHFDREWYREFEEFRLRLTEIFNVLFEEFEKGELDKFFFDGQTSSIDDYLQIHPENKSKIETLIKQGKLFLGPFYCLSDVFLVNSKCLQKNLEIGIKQAKSLGYKGDFCGYLADTFGHSNSVTQILNKFGFDNAVIWRGVGDMPSDFLWNGIKTTNLVQGYFHDEFNQNIDYHKKAEMIKKTLDKIAQKSSNVLLLPIGADHLCPIRNLKTQVKEVNKHLKDYEIVLGTPFDYFKLVQNNYKQNYQGEFLDNSKTFVLKGAYSCRNYIKQQNSYAQWLLTSLAEPFNALCNGNFQNEIDYAYKLIIQNHAHDSIYGCSTDEVDFEVQSRYKKANQVSNGIIKRLIRDNLKDNEVINLADFDFCGAIKIESDKKLDKNFNAQKISSKSGFLDSKLYNICDIPITEDLKNIKTYLVDLKNIKSKSISKICKENIETTSTLNITDNAIENKFIKLSVKNNKINVLDKINNKNYENILKITDRTDLGDSYNFAPKKGEKASEAKILDTKIIEKGHVRSVLQIKYKIKNEKFILNVILYNQNKYLEFELNYNNKRKNHLLQAVFNTPCNITKTVSEDTIGEIQREIDPDYDVDKFLPAPRGVELKLNVFPMQRYVMANKMGVITKGLQEYECFKNQLKITLLRSTDIISNPKNPARGTPAGPPLKFKGLECLGKNTYNFALTFSMSDIKNNSNKFYGVTLCAQV